MKKLNAVLLVIIIILSGVFGFLKYKQNAVKKEIEQLQKSLISGINSWISDNEDQQQRPENINALNSSNKKVYEYVDNKYISEIGNFKNVILDDENETKILILDEDKVIFKKGVLRVDPDGLNLVYSVLPMDNSGEYIVSDYSKYIKEGILLTSASKYREAGEDKLEEINEFESNYRKIEGQIIDYITGNDGSIDEIDSDDSKVKQLAESLENKPEGAEYEIGEKQFTATYELEDSEYVIIYDYESTDIQVSGAPKEATFANTDKEKNNKKDDLEKDDEDDNDHKENKNDDENTEEVENKDEIENDEDKDDKKDDDKQDKDDDNDYTKEANVKSFEANFNKVSAGVKSYLKAYKGPTGIESENNKIQKMANSLQDKPKGARYLVGTSELVCILPSKSFGEGYENDYVIKFNYATDETTLEGAPISYSSLAK